MPDEGDHHLEEHGMGRQDARFDTPDVSTGSGQLAGRVALVTGAGRNIGRAIALRLAAEGAAVAVSDLDDVAAKEVVEVLRADGHAAVAVCGDASDPATVDRLFDEVEAALGPVDALVNNAYARVGRTSFQPFLQVDIADWQSFMAANTSMFFASSQRMSRTLAQTGAPGTIVNVSSHGAARAHREHIPYDSVKGAMESFTRAIAVDLAPWNIRVNCVRPGSIAVEGEKLDWADSDDVRSTQIPLGRPGRVGDVASAILYLTSAESAYVTGQVFNIDGGMAAQARAPQVEPHWPAGPKTLTDIPARLLG